MEIRRFFINKENINDDTVTINGDEFDHIVKVLRHKVGFKIIVCCGDKNDIYCTISKIEKNYLTAKIDSIELNQNETKTDITLFQSISKSEKMDVIVQKAVELGVKKIIPFESSFSSNELKLERLNKISFEACKQCGRAILVDVINPVKFNDLKEILKDYDVILVGFENEDKLSFKDIDKGVFKKNKIAVIVGSEGGFSPQEILELRQFGAIVFSLGKRILRAETAAISIVTLVMNECGELAL